MNSPPSLSYRCDEERNMRTLLLKTRGNGLEGGVQRIQAGYFAVFRLALDERKILVGVVDSIPQCGAAGVRISHRRQRNMGGLHALLDKSGWRNWILS